MRFTEISESTTAGSVSTVAMPLGKTQARTQVSGLEPVKKVMGGTAKKKGPYANSISEGKKKVQEADLSEDDIILVPGQGRIKKTGFIKHDPDRAEHEGQTLKNSLHTIIRVATHLDNELTVRDNFPEWVSEKIGAVKSNMVTVMDYLISAKEMQGVAEGEENKYGSQENWDSLRKDIRSQYPYKKGTTVTVPHKGKLVNGKIVRYDAGGGGYSPAYVVDIGEYESIMVEPNKVRQGVAEGKIDFAKKIQKNVDKSNKAVVKTNKEVGSRVADIGAGGKEHNVKTDKAWDDAQKAKKAK